MTEDKKKDYSPLWHTTSHIMAHAVKELYPEVKLGIGPATSDGFYYDFYRREPFTPEDLKTIERKMKEVIAADYPVKRRELPRKEAEAFLLEKGERFKQELLTDIPGEQVSFYTQGEFMDLCAGPHLKSTGQVKSFALLSTAASYWRGDENRESMQRIYGISFPEKSQLKKYLETMREARERDHRRLGIDLELFSFQKEAGPGLVFWHPKGARVRRAIEEFMFTEQEKRGYQFVYTPHLAGEELWHTSGHMDFYRPYIFPPLEMNSQRLRVKPMNCPGHILIYRNRRRSYRELPLRMAELGTVYRLEKTGVLHGLMRVRGFTQDDAHIFCARKDLTRELTDVVRFTLDILRAFEFTGFEIYLSTRPDNYVGSVENWEEATRALKDGLTNLDLSYRVDPGEGVFYGPKIDIKIKDVLGRFWQCSTIQVDFNLPERFGLSFINAAGREEQPLMIHRALLGSLERFFGILIEHYKGAFPLWLAPVQVAILPVTSAANDYGAELEERLRSAAFRPWLNTADDTIGKKIRGAELEKIPVIAVVGQREKEAGTIAMRLHGKGAQEVLNLENFVAYLRRETDRRIE